MHKKYTVEQLLFLRNGYKKMTVQKLTMAFNKKFKLSKNEGQIKSTLKNHRFVCGRKGGAVTSLFTEKQILFVKYKYKTYGINELVIQVNNHFGLSIKKSQLRAFFKNHKITCGRTGCYEKGNIPWTSGTAGTGMCKPNAGSFKKGDVPANRNKLGSVRICKTDGYILVKIKEKNPYTNAPTRYKAKQLIIWERHKGPVPKGMNVTFIDGNKLNCKIENLELVTKAENLQRNRIGINKYPLELRPNIRFLAKLETTRFKKIQETRNIK